MLAEKAIELLNSLHRDLSYEEYKILSDALQKLKQFEEIEEQCE